MVVLRIIALKTVLQNYKIDVALNLVFSILGPYLQNININRLIIIEKLNSP